MMTAYVRNQLKLIKRTSKTKGKASLTGPRASKNSKLTLKILAKTKASMIRHTSITKTTSRDA